MLELLKIIVQPVVLERDVDGKIVGEKIGEAVPIYDLDTIAEYVTTIRLEVFRLNTGNETKEEANGRK